MEYRRMGKTGLQLSVLSFGSWVSFHKQIEQTYMILLCMISLSLYYTSLNMLFTNLSLFPTTACMINLIVLMYCIKQYEYVSKIKIK